MDFFRNIKHFVINCWDFRRILWNNRWWDHGYFFDYMREKLLIDNRKYKKHGMNLHLVDITDKQEVCIHLLKRLIDDGYYENVYKNHDKRWGELDASVENGVFNIFRTNVKTRQDKILEKKQDKILIKKEEELRNNDIKLLFRILEKNILKWWD